MQERTHQRAVLTGRSHVLGLEHRPVITLGKRGGEVDSARAAAAGYAIWTTRRGGLATCHEPGQLVGYVILDARAIGVRRLVEHVEDVLMGYLATLDVAAGRRAGLPGVWVRDRKIAAVGLQIRHGFSMHGFALNLTNDLRGFEFINPCGLTGVGVTSVAVERAGGSPAPASAWLSVGPVLTAGGPFAKPRNAPGT